MPIAAVRGVSIHYEVIGNSGPWFALVTGAGVATRSFASCAQAGRQGPQSRQRRRGVAPMFLPPLPMCTTVSATQCDIKTGMVMLCRIVRVTPPNTHSRAREWP